MKTFRNLKTIKSPLKNIKKIEPSESELQSQILRRLSFSKLVHWRQSLGGVPARVVNGKPIFRSNPMKGFPDLGGIVRMGNLGVLFAMEIKTKTGILSKEQKSWMKTLSESGCIVRVVRSYQQAEDFIAYLENLQQEYKELSIDILTRKEKDPCR